MLPLLFVPASRSETSSAAIPVWHSNHFYDDLSLSWYPSAITGGPVAVWIIAELSFPTYHMIASLTSMLISTAPLPSHLPSAPALPSQPRKSEISSGEFSVMWSANVLSCSLSLLIFCGNSCFRFFRNSSIFTHICKLRISAANPRNPLFPKQSRPNFPGQ